LHPAEEAAFLVAGEIVASWRLRLSQIRRRAVVMRTASSSARSAGSLVSTARVAKLRVYSASLAGIASTGSTRLTCPAAMALSGMP
jgi:hypothetical protein